MSRCPSMDDERLCQQVADVWQEAGGDAEGFAWVGQRRVMEILKEREAEAKAGATEEGGAE